MKFVLLAYAPPNAWPPEEHAPALEQSIQICRELASRGQYLYASPLEPVEKTVQVRIKDDRAIISDGPFAETKEFLAGFFLIDVPTMEDAIAVARSIPAATRGTTEIRPLVEPQLRRA